MRRRQRRHDGRHEMGGGCDEHAARDDGRQLATRSGTMWTTSGNCMETIFDHIVCGSRPRSAGAVATPLAER
jgi:hypothetical protein